MEAKFTKGEWIVKDRKVYSYSNFTYTRMPFTDADSKLIAAAPEIYDLLDCMIKTNGFVHEEDKQKAIELLTKINS